MTDQANPETPSQPERLTFDLAICEKLKQAAMQVLASHPEVRTVACVVDYYGDLNDADVQFGIWLGEHGTVMAPDQALGSMFATLKLWNQQFQTAVQLAANMRQKIEVLGAEINNRYAELQKLSGGDSAPAAGSEEEKKEVRPQADG